MFAGGDYLLRRLLSASPINQAQTSSWDTSTLLTPPPGLFTPNSSILSNGIFGINQSADSLLQDYNATLQLVQLQMLLNQQQQPNLELLVAAMALQQQQQLQLLPKLSPNIKKHLFDGDQSQEKSTILDHLISKQHEVFEPNKISPVSRNNSSPSCSSPHNSAGLTPPISLAHGEEAQEKVEAKKRKLETDLEVPSGLPAPGVSSKKRAKTSKKKLLRQDTETNSPVSGMFIKNACDVSADDRQKAIELDDTASYVNISEDSRAAIACIPNVIGESVCSLCKVKYEDVFRLAMHRCPRIMHEEYRCPECEKTFSCPANLASHRRWHRPKELTELAAGNKEPKKKTNICSKCSTQFETKSGLRSHRKVCGSAQTTQKQDLFNMCASQSPPGSEFTLDSLKMSSYPEISADLAANALISLAVSANKTVPVKVLI